MKKNWVSILVLSLTVLNLLLTAVIVFTMVPNTIKTNNLISKVASSIDIEVESLRSKDGINGSVRIEDIEVLPITGDITVNLKDSPNSSKKSFALISASLSLNSKSTDYSSLKDKVVANESTIVEIIRDEFSKYTREEAMTYKDAIKDDVITELSALFESDIIVGISLGKFIVD